MLSRLRLVAGAAVERTEAKVAVGDEGAHAELAGEGQRLAVITFSVLGAAGRRDVTGEAEGSGLAGPRPQPAAERQGLSGVAPGLVDPPSREGADPRAQQDERRPGVIRATAELLNGARHQRARLINPAGKGVGGTEGRGDDLVSEDDLPRAAEVEVPLEDPDRTWEIPATEVAAPETGQPEVQRVRMIGCFSDPHGGLGVSDGLIEPAELGQHVGEEGPRERRLDGGPPKALGAQIALECDVPLEQGRRVAELASGDVRQAQ